MYSGKRLLLGLVCISLIIFATLNISGMESIDKLVHPLTGDTRMAAEKDQARGASDIGNQAKETFTEQQYDDDDVSDVSAIIQDLLRKQRNQLSQAMIKLSQEFHQYQCTATGSKSISTSGGWCPRPNGTYRHKTDEKLAAAMVPLFNTGTVASFGDGGGGYKLKIDAAGLIQRYDSFDGAPFCENTTNGLVKYLDLTIPVYGMSLYDWVLSLEVGEHIPKAYEEIFLDNIVRHAKKGVVLSWAIPHQPGHGHVNSQPIDYIKNQLNIRGFYHDKNNSEHLQQNARYSWLRRNVNVYWRKPDHPVDMHML